MTIFSCCDHCTVEIEENESYIAQLSCGHIFHLYCLIACPNCDVCPECRSKYTTVPIPINFEYNPAPEVQDLALDPVFMKKLGDVIEAEKKKRNTDFVKGLHMGFC